MRLQMAGLEAHGHFLLGDYDTCLACGFFARSKTKVRGIAATFGKKYRLNFNYRNYDTENDVGWTGIFSTQNMGRDKFVYCLSVSKEVGKRYLLTTEESCHDDMYEYLMTNYKLPLKREWIPCIKDELLKERYCCTPYTHVQKHGGNPVIMSLNGKDVEIGKIKIFDFALLTEDVLEKVVSFLLSSGKIWITKKHIPPLDIESLDDYFKKYGGKAVDNLDKELKPLVELRPNVKNLALKQKSLFPQQAASVEGILAMEREGIKYAVLVHGMGCGKTIEAASVLDASMVGKWLKRNPGKTLRDAYAQEGNICYRAIIMAPGHLVSKWAQEVEEEIPYSKAVIIDRFEQLVELREAGKKPNGREFYIISKDFCKLDTQLSPIPVHIKKKYFSLDICSECREEQQMIVYKKGIGSSAECPKCRGKHFEPYPLAWLGRFRGLICPKCGELLIKNKRYDPDSDGFDLKASENVLTPGAFASAKGENFSCYHCGEALWGSNAKPLISGNAKPKEPKWRKISHFKNHTHKGTCTAFVLKGHEEDYYKTCVTTDGLKETSSVYGPRKVAPAHFIKRYLKGFFDFCVLDECHKYLGDSAQGTAAHTLIKASKFTLALTGTISNGTAECFFNLFWMLEPKRMIDLGYKYNTGELMRFCKEYGCVETVYEVSNSGDRSKNAMSRGRQLYPPRVKPGISPVLFGRLLLDRCLFMDISDLSKYLPTLKEEVVLVDPVYEIKKQYDHVIDVLKEASKGHTGMAALSAMLQFGLSYMDKPYGRLPIKDPFCKDALLCNVENFEQYASPDVLLPKEEKLIEIINEEIGQGRGVFVYATFTGKEETNVSYRLKDIIERYCNLKDRVEIIQSTSPAASKREAWFHKRASEGIKVFITNPMNVETGLDFCFKHNGVVYNFPTLIFYQTSYSLATIWQASRRAHRLNQKESCRNVYLAYSGTLQAAALEIMAQKQVATAAIQGHFSAEGLAAMAQGVDARAKLAEALSRNDMSSRESLENMFDALGAMNADVEEDAAYAAYKPSPSFWELIGRDAEVIDEYAGTIFAADICSEMENATFSIDDSLFAPAVEVSTTPVDDFMSFIAGFTNFGFEQNVSSQTKPATSKKKAVSKGQVSIFELLEGSI